MYFKDEMDYARDHENGVCDSTCDYCADERTLTQLRIQYIESKPMSQWSDAELLEYNQLTRQI